MDHSKLAIILSHSPPCELANWAKDDVFAQRLTSDREFLMKLSINLGLPFSSNIAGLCKFSTMTKGKLLIHACKTNDVRVFDLIINKYVIDRESFTKAAEKSIKHDNLKLLERLLDEDLDVENILLDAVVAGNIRAVKMLLNRGIKADFNSLRVAVDTDNLEIVKILLDYRDEIIANFNDIQDEGLILQSPEVARLILDTFGDVQYFVEVGQTIDYGGSYETIDLLVEYGLTTYNDILLHAGYSRDVKLMRHAFEKGATNVDAALIRFAAESSFNRVTRFLLESGATQVQEALYEAIRVHGDIKTIQLLVQYGAVIDEEAFRLARDTRRRGSTDIIEYLESEDV